jgi:hypothetical protein
MDDNHTTIKHVADGVSAVVALGTLLQWLPVVASILTIVWYLIRIGEYIASKFKGQKDA